MTRQPRTLARSTSGQAHTTGRSVRQDPFAFLHLGSTDQADKGGKISRSAGGGLGERQTLGLAPELGGGRRGEFAKPPVRDPPTTWAPTPGSRPPNPHRGHDSSDFQCLA